MDFYRHLCLRVGACAPVSYFSVYLISITFTFQTLLTAYSSSTYLEQFLTSAQVGLLFAFSAAGAAVVSLLLPKILRYLGNVATTLLFMGIMTLCLTLIALTLGSIPTIIAFIVFLIINPQIYLAIDIFMETLIGDDESATGSRRGLILTIMSTAAFFAPLAMGLIIGEENNLPAVYYFSAVVGLLFMLVVLLRFNNFSDPEYKTIHVMDMVRGALMGTSVQIVLFAQFLLQFFYSWAIIYVPLYLATEVGLSWPVISQILAAGLLAFIIFEYPIGLLADKKWGEKEMMAVGFVILAIAASSISFMASIGVLGWMALMFFSRFGASLVEVTTESYFFKQVRSDDANLIALFRLMRPLANVCGALVGGIALFFLPFHFIFFILGIIMSSGILAVSRLVDTR